MDLFWTTFTQSCQSSCHFFPRIRSYIICCIIDQTSTSIKYISSLSLCKSAMQNYSRFVFVKGLRKQCSCGCCHGLVWMWKCYLLILMLLSSSTPKQHNIVDLFTKPDKSYVFSFVFPPSKFCIYKKCLTPNTHWPATSKLPNCS